MGFLAGTASAALAVVLSSTLLLGVEAAILSVGLMGFDEALVAGFTFATVRLTEAAFAGWDLADAARAAAAFAGACFLAVFGLAECFAVFFAAVFVATSASVPWTLYLWGRK